MLERQRGMVAPKGRGVTDWGDEVSYPAGGCVLEHQLGIVALKRRHDLGGHGVPPSQWAHVLERLLGVVDLKRRGVTS